MSKLVLGLIGAAGCGKSTAAKAIQAEDPFVLNYNMARPLKQLCAMLYGWNLARLDDLDYKETVSNHHFVGPEEYEHALHFEGVPFDGPVRERMMDRLEDIRPEWTRRKILQHVGTDVFRAEDPDHWVKQAKGEIALMLDAAGDNCHGVLLADVRFKNEAAMIRDLGGRILRLERVGDQVGTAEKGHVSEQEWQTIKADGILLAKAGDLDKLRREAVRFWNLWSA